MLTAAALSCVEIQGQVVVQFTVQQPRLKKSLVSANGSLPAELDLVRKGMWKVVNGAGGTARGIRTKAVEIAGKTGTAQAWLAGMSHKDEKKKAYKRAINYFASSENSTSSVCA